MGKFFTLLPLSPRSMIWCQRKLGSKQAHRATSSPRVHGVATSVCARLTAGHRIGHQRRSTGWPQKVSHYQVSPLNRIKNRQSR